MSDSKITQSNPQIQEKIVLGYDGIEKALQSVEGKRDGVWIGSASGRWIYATVDRKIWVNVGLAEHTFNSFSEAINYITEFLFN
ncbi:MAG: hypothetical protein KAT69_07120 [Candidatus Aminicenantes bacterium]|nr:hypothetical protein [Candidatus Aminicenantes bacterium]